MVTVDSVTTTNLIVWEKPVTTSIDHYRIYRETTQVGLFQLIDTVNYASISVFNDVVASPKTKSWRYKISAVNACGDESSLSNSHKTIHLVTEDLGSGEYKVTWDNYEGFLYNDYDLYRFTNASGWELILDNIPYLALPYTLDTPSSIDGLDYMIEIDPGFQCTATFGKAQDYNSSRSNKARGDFNPGSGTGDPNNSIVEYESESMNVSIYPNPSNGVFNVDMDFSDIGAQAAMTITDISGKIISQQEVVNGINVLNLEHIKTGIYLVSIQDDQNNIVVRILKN
jgi:fibronectin type 3 domain-containing protein